MAMSVGIDIERVERFRLPKESGFLTDNFTEQEIAYAYGHSQPEIHLAGFFCVKESFLKCTGENRLLKEIEIVHGPSGKPVLHVSDAGTGDTAVSISHAGEYAIGTVIRWD